MQPMMITHGGAGFWQDINAEVVEASMRQATTRGWEVLKAGGSALEAVEKATNILEDDPLFDAGIGSYLNHMGEVEMDALLTDGRTLNYGAVAGLLHVQYPISLARLVLEETPHCFFAGAGADMLGAKFGLPMLPNINFVTDRILEAFRQRQKEPAGSTGTVGAVAIDAQGNLASATSTGGTNHKPKGRVGDVPLYGCGGYADNRGGAASATGAGEHIMRVFLTKYAVDQMSAGQDAQSAATAAMHYIEERFTPSNVGLIVIDKEGRPGAAHTTRHMPISWVDANGVVQSMVSAGLTGLR